MINTNNETRFDENAFVGILVRKLNEKSLRKVIIPRILARLRHYIVLSAFSELSALAFSDVNAL